MKSFITLLHEKNETLFIFGFVCLILSVVFLILSKAVPTQVQNVNAWYKPFKFSFSIFLYSWTMILFCSYLKNFNISLFNWSVIILLGFEIIYIAIQAAKGQQSHFNTSTTFYSLMYGLMGTAAALITIYTAYIGILFCFNTFPDLPPYYLLSIRIAIFIFVVFSFEGFLMGSRMSHTIGGADGSSGIPILNWSMSYGDARIAHFFGMHALQVLPLLSFYLFKSSRTTIIAGIAYMILATIILIQALQGKPLIKGSQTEKVQSQTLRKES